MEKEIQLDEKAVGTIAEAVSKGLASTIDAKISEAFAKQAEATEKTIKKDIADGGEEEGTNPQIKIKSNIETLPKEIRFMRQTKALQTGDAQKLKEFNRYAIETKNKAGYANETIDADGGYLVPDADFEATVETLSEDYGIALRDADIRRVNSDSVKTNKRGSNVTMYEVNTEGGQKQGTKMTFAQETVTLREFAAIATATNRLNEDAAVDYWAEITQGFAEEYARWADILVFTDLTSGILHDSGVNAETVGANITSITWDDLMNAEVKVPTKAYANGKHYMHRSIWNILRQTKASTSGEYYFAPSTGAVAPWGTPIVLTDSLPASTVVGDGNEPFGVFGDLKRSKLYIKRGMLLAKADQATVHDADGNSINLFEKNMTALRAEIRMANLVKFPEAFCIYGTGSVS